MIVHSDVGLEIGVCGAGCRVQNQLCTIPEDVVGISFLFGYVHGVDDQTGNVLSGGFSEPLIFLRLRRGQVRVLFLHQEAVVLFVLENFRITVVAQAFVIEGRHHA